MAGANYMGGKRNAAKARTKDKTGRIHKGHFGKQRPASVFSRRENPFQNSIKRSFESVLPEMGLAHAHSRSREFETDDRAETNLSRGTEPTYLPRTPNYLIGKHSKRSKALKTLDTMQRVWIAYTLPN
ncbi:hypothetical protein BJ138DRAFT_1131424 [Hygrophoropsis aurantiaca]|uniref:Uncharacterized protein n=1 Tax=Hygrophoropsis aurantiaca TaxID=72124 RepID=A0ACB7ZRB8_9AGAM|nr:hypothetical protein BJ138DRAFT_1131424 [Hygrophoropsis aurantiaca]